MEILIIVAFIAGFITHKIYDYFSPFVLLFGNDTYRNKVEPDTNLENQLAEYMKRRFNEDHIVKINNNKLQMKELKIRPDGWIYTMRVLTDEPNGKLAPKVYENLVEYLQKVTRRKEQKNKNEEKK